MQPISRSPGAQLLRLSAALVDRYALERELRSGGMATVYLAHDRKHDRAVAIKILRPDVAAALGPERFLREIRITSGLLHPNIVPLHDSGIADGFLFYVMPYVEGQSLQDRLKADTQLSVPDAIRIAREVADALDYAHRQGVIHRDVKPANILLHDGHALLADFGLALVLGHDDSERLTDAGLPLGTPSYMSPEQARCDPQLTERSDIYGLGAVLYEMLAGEPPFVGATVQATVGRALTETVPSVRARRGAVPAGIQQVIEIALSKVPARRFGSAREFSQALSASCDASDRERPRPNAARRSWPAMLRWAAAGIYALTA